MAYEDHEVRFTVITDGVIRLEWAPNGTFTNNKSFVAINRAYPKAAYQLNDTGDFVEISTTKMTLKYRKGSGQFSSENLTITSAQGIYSFEWKPGTKQQGNLKETYCTLDGIAYFEDVYPAVAQAMERTPAQDTIQYVGSDKNYMSAWYAVVSWKSLDFQPYFNATASNVLYGYWSHDLGGHYGSAAGAPDIILPEMYTRWMQFGALSPIMRTHATKSGKMDKRPWVFGHAYFETLRQTILERYQLAPYIYTMARKTYDEGLSLCRPMYYDYPETKEAFEFRNEYMFGDEMFVASITAPMSETGYSTQKVWLPEGSEWYEWHTGTLFQGGQTVDRRFAIDEYPIYVKAGAILPLYDGTQKNLMRNDESILVTVFPGNNNGEFLLYEDNGNDKNYAENYAVTKLSSIRKNNNLTITVGARKGSYQDMPTQRSFRLKVLVSAIFQKITVKSN